MQKNSHFQCCRVAQTMHSSYCHTGHHYKAVVLLLLLKLGIFFCSEINLCVSKTLKAYWIIYLFHWMKCTNINKSCPSLRGTATVPYVSWFLNSNIRQNVKCDLYDGFDWLIQTNGYRHFHPLTVWVKLSVQIKNQISNYVTV